MGERAKSKILKKEDAALPQKLRPQHRMQGSPKPRIQKYGARFSRLDAIAKHPSMVFLVRFELGPDDTRFESNTSPTVLPSSYVSESFLDHLFVIKV
jgi:hypothetical protein